MVVDVLDIRLEQLLERDFAPLRVVAGTPESGRGQPAENFGRHQAIESKNLGCVAR
jgi:hypothetical protein